MRRWQHLPAHTPRAPFWVALHEHKCIGQNYHKLRDFCRERALSHGHSVTWKYEYNWVFMFAEEADGEAFKKEFGGEPMHPSEKGHGKNWAWWKKGTHIQNHEVHELVD